MGEVTKADVPIRWELEKKTKVIKQPFPMLKIQMALRDFMRICIHIYLCIYVRTSFFSP